VPKSRAENIVAADRFVLLSRQIQNEQGKSKVVPGGFYLNRTACRSRGSRPFVLRRSADVGESENQIARRWLPEQLAPTPGGLGHVRRRQQRHLDAECASFNTPSQHLVRWHARVGLSGRQYESHSVPNLNHGTLRLQ